MGPGTPYPKLQGPVLSDGHLIRNIPFDEIVYRICQAGYQPVYKWSQLYKSNNNCRLTPLLLVSKAFSTSRKTEKYTPQLCSFVPVDRVRRECNVISLASRLSGCL
ncbi:hypothetical protein TWF694_001794 [Orbilia ellipsospora]|uniref:Uncharacterized protein n=1 Tax=Orbilia ellipsospora TaxID=2528407 RepID=A0AAV9X3M7_9PEZI